MMAARAPIALPLAQQQVAGLARAATLEQLREKLETGGGAEGPERKMARLAEEQQRLMQQAFQHNLLAMASQMPMNLRLAAPAVATRGQCCYVYPAVIFLVNFRRKRSSLSLFCFCYSEEKQQDMSLSISTNGNASITVSVEVNGTIYSGEFLLQNFRLAAS